MSTHNPETLCFLHGWGFDKRVLEKFMARFVPEWQVKALSLPGYNGAPLAKGIEGVARALIPEVPDNAILIGWSLGGMIGIRIATLKPVKKLILLASTPCFVNKPDWPYGTAPELLQGLSRRIKDGPERALREFALLISRGDNKPRTTYQVLATLLKGNVAHTSALLDGLDILQNADLRAELSGLGRQTGIVLAENDPLVSVASREMLLSLCTGLELNMISGAGHAPFLSRPAHTRRLLHTMLSHTQGS